MPVTADLIASTEVHVIELRPLLRGKMQETGLDILFVHGSLWNDTARARGSRRTWMQRDNPDVCWPEDWLPADLDFNVRMLSVSYNDVALREKDIPKQEIADVIAHKLGQLLFPRWELGRKRPVVLVGHEFGGDVIESLVMEAKGIVTNTGPPRSYTLDWVIMSRTEAFVRNVVQIVVYARQRVHDNWELNKDGSADDSCSLFLCNPKSRFVQGIELFPSWEEKAVWSLDSPGEHGDVWKPPNERHESYSLLLKSLLQARHEEHWKSPISADLESLLHRFYANLDMVSEVFGIQHDDHLPSLESVLQESIGETIVTSKVQVPEQRIQFLFGNAKSMAEVVGVGVDFATVYLSRENLITIEKINQLEWGQLWREALQDGSSFYEPILIYKLPFTWGYLSRFLGTSDSSYLTMLRVLAFFFMTRNLLQLNAMAIHDCLQGGSSCLGMPSGKDKIVVKTETCQQPSLEFLWDVLGCVGKHGVGCKCCHGEGDEDTIGDGGSATPGTNIVGRRVAQKRDHEDMPSASEGHHEGRESTCAEGERNYGHGDTPSEGGEGGEGGGRNIAGEKDYHDQDDENVHKVGGKDGEGHPKSEKDRSTGILECSWLDTFQFLNFKGGEGEHGGKESASRGSGGNGGGDAPGERGEGGSNPGGGDDDRLSCHDGSGNPSEGTRSETSVVVRVHPKHHPSNCRWEENGEHIDLNDQDLKEISITPRLELQFLKEGDSKLLTTKMFVSFDIAAAKPKPGHKDVNNKRFGWFQKCLSVSLQCLHDNAAQLQPHIFADTKDTTKTDKTNTQTTSGAWQRSLNLSAPLPVLTPGLAVGKSTKTTTTCQGFSMETPTEHIRGGFLAQDNSERGQRHRLSYDFVYQNPPEDIKDTQGKNWSMYLNTGMCHTLNPSINGTWDDLNDEESSEYEFRAQREVCELTKDARWFKNRSLMKKLSQIYEMKLYINHKMTHIEKLVDRTLTLTRRPDKCELVGVDTLPVIDSDGASSSAQQRI